MSKKVFFIILVLLLTLPSFAQKKIGTVSSKNIIFATAINDKPVYAYYEFDDLLGRQIYLSYKGSLYGPYNYMDDKYDFTENRIALIAEKNEEYIVFVNGKEYGPYQMAYAGSFISDTEYAYYVYKQENDTEWGYDTDFYVNGKFYPDVMTLQKSPKGLEAKVIYNKQKDQYFVEYNNQKFGPYDENIFHLDFLSDGKTLIYTAVKNNKSYFVLNGKEIGSYDKIGLIQFSLDKKHYAYFYKQNEKFTLIKDGTTIGSFPELYQDYNDYLGMPFLRFVQNSNNLCFFEHNKQDGSYNLHFGDNTYLDVEPYNFTFNNNSVLYLKTARSHTFDAYIDGKQIQEDIRGIFPSPKDLNDYAYLSSKKISLSEQPGLYYGSPDYDDDDIFYADCFFYKNKEYLLQDKFENAYLLNNGDLFYTAIDMDSNLNFYSNGKIIYSVIFFEDSPFKMKLRENDFCYFSMEYDGEKIYYNGKIYPGTATDKQIVYVDDGVIYLKKY